MICKLNKFNAFRTHTKQQIFIHVGHFCQQIAQTVNKELKINFLFLLFQTLLSSLLGLRF